MVMHLTAQELSKYANRTLAPAALLTADAHLTECDPCRQRLQSVLQASIGDNRVSSFLLGELPTSAAEFHLSFEQITGYLAASLDTVEQEIVTSHLPFCPNCQAEVEDLRAFQQQLATLSEKATAAGPTSFAPPLAVHEKLARFWPTRKIMIPLTAALILGAMGLVFYRRRRKKTASQLHAPNQTADGTPSPQISAVPPATPGSQAAPLSPEEQAIQQALATGRVEVAAASKQLQRRSAKLVSGKALATAFAILSPQGTLVESTQPHLHWAPLPQAKTYVVIVTDQDLNEVAHSEPLTQTSWKISVTLTRGQLYQWQVTATTETGKEVTTPAHSAPEAKFKVLAAEALQTLQRARAHYAGAHLELGILYAYLGLLDEAAQEVTREQVRTSLAQRLQQSLAQQRR